jgi:hypothetical protein
MSRPILKAHTKGHYRTVNGKVVHVQDHDDSRPNGQAATLSQRTAIGKHKSGTAYLRATDSEDGGHIQAAAQKLGIEVTKRRAGANHHGRVGAYDHYHVENPEHAVAIHDELKKKDQAAAEASDPEHPDNYHPAAQAYAKKQEVLASVPKPEAPAAAPAGHTHTPESVKAVEDHKDFIGFGYHGHDDRQELDDKRVAEAANEAGLDKHTLHAHLLSKSGRHMMDSAPDPDDGDKRKSHFKKWFGNKDNTKAYGIEKYAKELAEMDPSAETAQAAKAPPPKDDSFYHAGDKVRYTGKKQTLHGGEFHEFEYLDGHKKGKTGVTMKGPQHKTEAEAHAEANAAAKAKTTASKPKNPGKVGDEPLPGFQGPPPETDPKDDSGLKNFDDVAAKHKGHNLSVFQGGELGGKQYQTVEARDEKGNQTGGYAVHHHPDNMKKATAHNSGGGAPKPEAQEDAGTKASAEALHSHLEAKKGQVGGDKTAIAAIEQRQAGLKAEPKPVEIAKTLNADHPANHARQFAKGAPKAVVTTNNIPTYGKKIKTNTHKVSDEAHTHSTIAEHTGKAEDHEAAAGAHHLAAATHEIAKGKSGKMYPAAHSKAQDHHLDAMHHHLKAAAAAKKNGNDGGDVTHPSQKAMEIAEELGAHGGKSKEAHAASIAASDPHGHAKAAKAHETAAKVAEGTPSLPQYAGGGKVKDPGKWHELAAAHRAASKLHKGESGKA